MTSEFSREVQSPTVALENSIHPVWRQQDGTALTSDMDIMSVSSTRHQSSFSISTEVELNQPASGNFQALLFVWYAQNCLKKYQVHHTSCLHVSGQTSQVLFFSYAVEITQYQHQNDRHARLCFIKPS